MNKPKQKLRKVFWAIVNSLLIVCLIGVGFYMIEGGGKTLLKEFSKDYENVIWDNSSLIILECRYPLGSIFNKDEISIKRSELVIHERSFWNDKVSTLPYSKIKEITFTEGFYWRCFTVKREGFLGSSTTIYFKKKETKDLVKDVLSVLTPETVIIEKRSLLTNLRVR